MGVEMQPCLEQQSPEQLYTTGDHDMALLVWQYHDAGNTLMVSCCVSIDLPICIMYIYVGRQLIKLSQSFCMLLQALWFAWSYTE